MANIPTIRVDGYDGDWNKSKIEEVATFSKGSGYSKSDIQDTGTPLVLYGRLYTKYETVIDEVDTFCIPKERSVLSKGGEVIVPASGESVEDISVAAVVKNAGVVLGGDVNIITPQKDLSSTFLAQAITHSSTHHELSKLAQGKTVVHLRNSDIKSVDISYPSAEEQTDISNFFLKFDTLISLQQEKLDKLVLTKKAMLRKMFPQDGATVPEIRFKGFEGEWISCELGDIVAQVVSKNTELESTRPLTISAQYGLIDQTDFFNKRIASKDLTGYYLVQKGDYAYNKSTSNDAPWGAIKRLDEYENGAVSTLYIVFRIIDNQICSDFLNVFFDSNKWHNHIRSMAAEGARNHGLLNIDTEDFLKMPVVFPEKPDEQRMVGEYFNYINDLIFLYRRKVDVLKRSKKALLSKMFV